MILRAGIALAGLGFAAGAPAFAADSGAAGSVQLNMKSSVPPVAQLLQQGFDVKTGFVDALGVAYLVMQKGTSAYLCHAGAAPACDKLN